MKYLLSALKHIGILLIFFIISAVYFHPVFDGYQLEQGDISRFKGMSKELVDHREVNDSQSLWTNSMFGGMPAYQISTKAENSFPAAVITTIRTVFPDPVGILWLAMTCFYILCLCLKIDPWIGLIVSIAYGLASFNILYLGAGHASKVVAVALMPGLIGGILLTFRGKWIYGLAISALFGALQLAANHPQMTYYMVILIVFIVIEESIRLLIKGDLKKVAVSGAVLAVAGIISLLPNITGLMMTYEYSKSSTRGESELQKLIDQGATQSKDGLGEDYILEYSMARGEFWSSMIPNVKGGASNYLGNIEGALDGLDSELRQQVAQSPSYWGEQLFTGGAFYYGAVIMALFFLGMFYLKDRLKWPLFIAVLLAVFLSWKQPSGVTHFFLDYVPFFNKFRDTKMMLILLQLAAPLIAGLTLSQMRKEENPFKNIWLLIGAGVPVLLMLTFVVMPGSLFEFFSQAEQSQFRELLEQSSADVMQQGFLKKYIASVREIRIDVFRSDAVRSLLFVIIGLIAALSFVIKKVPTVASVAVLGLLIMTDLWSVDRRYLDAENPSKNRRWVKSQEYDFPFEASKADLAIFNAEVTNAGIQSKVEARVAFAEQQRGKKFTKRNYQEREAAEFAALNANTNFRVLNFTGPFSDARTSYFHKSIGGYHGAKLKSYQELIDFRLNDELSGFAQDANSLGLIAAFKKTKALNMLNTKYIIADPNQDPLPNPMALGNAWFVSNLEMVNTADDELLGIDDIDVATEALVHKDFAENLPGSFSPDSSASIVLTSYAPNQLEYKTESNKEQFAVFSEIYYPKGWEVTIDGNPAEYVRANYILRAMVVPAGAHTILFTFNPAAYNTGTTLALVGSILLFLLLICAFWDRIKSLKTVQE